MNDKIRTALLSWYDKNARSLPWRDRDAKHLSYRVWTSEVMLQQTKVETVVKYFAKWMERFPTVEKLSEATLEEVHGVWAGLGYYRRATNFHKAAIEVVKERDGKIPETAKELAKLPGIGRYTAGAISSIAFGKVESLVDGNIFRVFARWKQIDGDIKENKVVAQFWEIADEMIDEKRPGDWNQALMELGATVCTPKNPKCSSCPVSEFCGAYKAVNDKSIGSVEIYPRKSKKTKRDEAISVCVITCKNKYLIQKRPESGLLANLWEFPNFEVDDDVGKEPVEEFLSSLEYLCDELKYCGEIQHIFTHIKQKIHVYKIDVPNQMVPEGTVKWVPKGDFVNLAFSTQMKKVLQKVGEEKNEISNYFKKKKVEK